MINEKGIPASELRLSPAYLAEIIKLVDAGTVNTSTGKSLLDKVENSGRAPSAIVQAEGLAKVSDTDAIRAVCAEVLAESPEQAASYKGGKVTLMGWFVGQVMKKMRGKADPQVAKAVLEELLAK
jgi:aspartyl-tRNA(Asn)/glutamyl-tRNA(Gln) amidotransferase subunit B